MTKEKRNAKLAVALDILCDVHSDICHALRGVEGLTEQSFEVIHKLVLLMERLDTDEGGEEE